MTDPSLLYVFRYAGLRVCICPWLGLLGGGILDAQNMTPKKMDTGKTERKKRKKNWGELMQLTSKPESREENTGREREREIKNTPRKEKVDRCYMLTSGWQQHHPKTVSPC